MSLSRRGLLGPSETWLGRSTRHLRFKSTTPLSPFCSVPSTDPQRILARKKKFDNFDDLRSAQTSTSTPPYNTNNSYLTPPPTPYDPNAPSSPPPPSTPVTTTISRTSTAYSPRPSGTSAHSFRSPNTPSYSPSPPNPASSKSSPSFASSPSSSSTFTSNSSNSSSSPVRPTTPYRPQTRPRFPNNNASTVTSSSTTVPQTSTSTTSTTSSPATPRTSLFNTSNATSTANSLLFPKMSPFGAVSKAVPPSNLSLALINALSVPVNPKPVAPLSSFRSSNPRRAMESENQRLYELEQKKLREQQKTTPPPAPMRAWFKTDTTLAATRSPLQGAEVTSVHTAGDITRWKTDYRNPAAQPEPTDKLRLALSKVARQKEIFLEHKWRSWALSQEREEKASHEVVREKKAKAVATADDLPVTLVRRTKVSTFSKLTGIATSAILDCLHRGSLINEAGGPNTIIDMAAQEYVCIEFGRTPSVQKSKDVEESLSEPGEPRPPVVCVMGHVDHGKTSLLDRLRKSNVQESEAGGITQSIGAFAVPSGAVFLDTPGHAAFSSMRARGADKHATDLVVLVVAVDSGVQPQTIEAIELAQANEVPIIVAVTKCDLGGDLTDIRRQLLAHGLQDEAHGGDTQFVSVSSKTGQGMDDLVEAIGAMAELLDLRAPVQAPCRAYVIECSQRQGLGCAVNVVVRSGTLNVGDIVVCGTESVKVRALFNERGDKIKSCGPSTPAAVFGFKDIDRMGPILRGVKSEQEGAQIVEERLNLQREKELAQAEPEREGGRVLRVVVKAATKGGLEAFMKYVNALPQDVVQILVLKSGVGQFTDGDIQMASRFGAELFGFGSTIPENLAEDARIKGVRVVSHDIIYQLMDAFRESLSKQLPFETKVEVVGTAEVLQAFARDGKRGKIIHCAGARVSAGKLVSRDAKGGKIRYRQLRDGQEVASSGLERLFHFKDEVQLIEKGKECCVVLEDIKEFRYGDVLECVCTTVFQPTFDDSAGRAS